MVVITFTRGCNSRCPSYHNSGPPSSDTEKYETQENILAFLEKCRWVLEGIYTTGGKPTLQLDLEEFIQKIRSLGLAVKLDTNGYIPGIPGNSCAKALLDCVAMDIRAGWNHYEEAIGVSDLSTERANESIELLLSGSVPHESRTTVACDLYTSDDFGQIGSWIKGCPEYYLQCFTKSGRVPVPGVYSGFTRNEVTIFAGLVRPYVGQVSLRGVDYQPEQRLHDKTYMAFRLATPMLRSFRHGLILPEGTNYLILVF